MTRLPPHRPAAPSRAVTLSLADDLSVIARLEAVMRRAGADRAPRRRTPALRRLADWMAGLR